MDSKNDMLLGKPANDILNRRDVSASVKPSRAIGEMVQNARDVSASECNIVFLAGMIRLNPNTMVCRL